MLIGTQHDKFGSAVQLEFEICVAPAVCKRLCLNDALTRKCGLCNSLQKGRGNFAARLRPVPTSLLRGAVDHEENSPALAFLGVRTLRAETPFELLARAQRPDVGNSVDSQNSIEVIDFVLEQF